MDSQPLNMIISGLGGQGVFTLTKVIWKLCRLSRFQFQSSIFKGGAQKHGSIHAVIRIFLKGNDHYDMYSTQIPEGQLDLIIGLEAWETLRYQKYFGPNSRIYFNTQTTPFHVERLSAFDNKNPVKLLHSFNLDTVSKNYTEQSIQIFKTSKMANFLLGLEVIKSEKIKFRAADYKQLLCDQIRANKDLTQRILNF